MNNNSSSQTMPKNGFNQMEKKLMRDPDQIGSQMMNKGNLNNNSSLMFSNRSAHNMSGVVQGHLGSSTMAVN